MKRFCGVELTGGAWWDLFCSLECCEKNHPGERPEWFTVREFYEHTGRPVSSSNSFMECFECGKALVIRIRVKSGVVRIGVPPGWESPEDVRVTDLEGHEYEFTGVEPSLVTSKFVYAVFQKLTAG